jgi:alkylation response protein AidB-like acyl-CoA dehydrogenase
LKVRKMTEAKTSSAGSGQSCNRQALRDRLLAAVDAIGPVLDADAPAGDRLRHLPPVSLDALITAGLLGLKVPLELGGDEADTALQFEVIERTAYYSGIAAWCLFIYTDSLGKAAAHLPDAGVSQLMAGGKLPVMCGGGGLISGTLSPVTRGFRLSGKWIYGSGMDGAQWVMVFGALARDGAQPQVRVCIVPRSAIEALDNWHVLGLKGTGSADFTATDVFVPDEMTFELTTSRRRGGAMLSLGLIGYGGHAIPAVALGIARRVFDDLARIAEQKARGYSVRTRLAHRGAFQSFLGQADLKLQASRALMLGLCERIAADTERSTALVPSVEAEFRAAGAFVVHQAVELVSGAIRYLGGDGIRADGVFDRALRDLHVAATHFTVSDAAYENHAKFLLRLPEADPLA